MGDALCGLTIYLVGSAASLDAPDGSGCNVTQTCDLRNLQVKLSTAYFNLVKEHRVYP